MIKVAGYWDIWFSHKENEYDICWRFMLKHFGVDQAIMLPQLNVSSRIQLDHTEVELIEMDSIEDVINLNINLVPIMIDERGATSLKTFEHPDNALYIFGRTGENAMDKFDVWNGHSVYIDSVESCNGMPLLHPHQACSIVLYDRMTKQWQ